MPAEFVIDNRTRADLSYIAGQAGLLIPVNDLEVEGLDPALTQGVSYEAGLREAFNFLRRHDDGRYSSVMKMRVLQASEDYEATRLAGGLTMGRAQAFPGLLLIRAPFSYDEDTEVKSGGTLGVAVVWQNEGGRLLLAVNQNKRRVHVGTFMMSLLRNYIGVGSLRTWLNQSNFTGQQFALSSAMTVTGLNRAGGVSYEWGHSTSEDGVEDHIDPLDTMRPRGRRDPRPF